VRHRAIGIGAVLAVLGLVLTGTAQARNPNCAGGIQYVFQGDQDKKKGNLEDYRREMLKAVERLTMCAEEDPADFEALGYLGWAYAEMDSADLAGKAFEKSIDGLTKKEPKKVDQVESWRKSYWVQYYNDGLSKLQAARATYPDLSKEPADDTDRQLKNEAAEKCSLAVGAFTRAAQIMPANAQSYNMLGAVYDYKGDTKAAEEALRSGLDKSPGDSTLKANLVAVRARYAGKLIDEKKYDEAITFFNDLVKTDSSNADLHLNLGIAHFERARTLQGDARKPEFKLAGEEYGRASDLKGGNADLLYNSAIAYQQADETASAEKRWNDLLRIRSDDTEAMGELATTYANQKRFDEAAAILHKAVNLKPKDAGLHRRLSNIYQMAGNASLSQQEIYVWIALDRGQAAPDAAEAAKKATAATDAGKMLASMGTPDEVRFWEASGQKYQTWLYWSKNSGATFQANGLLIAKSDWGAPPPKLGAPAGAAPAKPPAGKKK
jgi:tetratricopeptide (TPR) repeat protein